MAEYSITAEEMQEIVQLMADGWKCDELTECGVLYLRLSNGTEKKEFEFVEC